MPKIMRILAVAAWVVAGMGCRLGFTLDLWLSAVNGQLERLSGVIREWKSRPESLPARSC